MTGLEGQKAEHYAPTGNRTQGKCLEGTYVTTTPQVLLVDMTHVLNILNLIIEIRVFGPFISFIKLMSNENE